PRPEAGLARGGGGDGRPFSRLRRLVLTGLGLLLPLLITVWLPRPLFNLVPRVVAPVILRTLRVLPPPPVDHPAFTPSPPPHVGVAATALLILLVGALAGNLIGRQIVAAFDRLMLRIPLIKGIYGATRQLMDAFDSKSAAFQRVVAVEYPRPGVFTI